MKTIANCKRERTEGDCPWRQSPEAFWRRSWNPMSENSGHSHEEKIERLRTLTTEKPELLETLPPLQRAAVEALME